MEEVLGLKNKTSDDAEETTMANHGDRHMIRRFVEYKNENGEKVLDELENSREHFTKLTLTEKTSLKTDEELSGIFNDLLETTCSREMFEDEYNKIMNTSNL
nr:uncharacterized protein LOC107445674 isoform X3 [Parasteatoda tepidariorum]